MILNKLVDQIYDAAVDLKTWPATLSAIADSLQACSMSLTIADPDGGSAPVALAPRTDPQWVRAYCERWAASNPVRDRGCALPPGDVYDLEHLGIPRAEFDRTPFYNEFWAPQRLSCALLMLAAKQHGAVSAIGFYRSSGKNRFAADDERLLRTLAPHLHRAVSLNLRLMRAEMQRDSMAEMLNRLDYGALLVDSQARTLFANAAAEALLSHGGGLQTSGGRLTTRMRATAVRLRELIAGGLGGVVTVSNTDGTILDVEIVPLRTETAWLQRQSAAIVFVRGQQPTRLPSCEWMRFTFGLTPAQAALARELLHGDGVPAAATRLGISRSTARSHLGELFQKTGTNRQAELVRLILQRMPANRGPRV